ncbi:MAG: hypothetical protein HOP16_05190 [Acidobacteria bacterium]|nr:hypothetical protein [Acidobacteriota bacterium]
MAKRKNEQTATTEQIEPRMTAFAEQLGRMVGTMQVKAEDWMNRETLLTQLAAVRDGATHLLDQVTSLASAAVAKKDTKKPAPRRASKGRSGGVVDAPGKKHRKQGPKDPGATLARSQAAKRRAAMPMAKTSSRRGRG